MKKRWFPGICKEDIWPEHSSEPVIFINAMSLCPGGSFVVIQNYLLNFIRMRPKWRFFVLQDTLEPQFEYGEIGPNVCVLYCSEKRFRYVKRYLWEQRWLGRTTRELGCDLYFGPNGVYHSRVRIPQCLLIQDPTPFLRRAPNLKLFLRNIVIKRKWMAGVRNAACMGYTSYYMRNLVVDYAQEEEQRHFIAYNGINDEMHLMAEKPFAGFEQRESFILSVSAINPHKNYETLIRALARLRQKKGYEGYRLKIMGRLIVEGYYRYLQKEISRLNLTDAVEISLDRPWGEITAAMQSARVFSLTSLYESFGIPALEAMAHGTPVVVGETTAVPEVCGDAAILVPAEDADAVAEAWFKLLEDRVLYHDYQEKGRRRCLEFSWEKTAKEWIEVFEKSIISDVTVPIEVMSCQMR